MPSNEVVVRRGASVPLANKRGARRHALYMGLRTRSIERSRSRCLRVDFFGEGGTVVPVVVGIEEMSEESIVERVGRVHVRGIVLCEGGILRATERAWDLTRDEGMVQGGGMRGHAIMMP